MHTRHHSHHVWDCIRQKVTAEEEIKCNAVSKYNNKTKCLCTYENNENASKWETETYWIIVASKIVIQEYTSVREVSI